MPRPTHAAASALGIALLAGLLASPPAAAAEAPAPLPADAPTLAVLYFDYAGEDGDLAVLRKGLAQMLISDLSASPTVRLVERTRLEEVLAELKLQRSRRIDPATAARVGKLLGARWLVLGAYFELMGTLRVDARLVEVETGRLLGSVAGQGAPEGFLEVERTVAEGLEKLLAEAAPPPAAPGGDARPERRRTAKRPARLPVRTAVRYAKALDAADRGDAAAAKAGLREVLEEAPDFTLASADLDRLMR